jgi:hypothetical protein
MWANVFAPRLTYLDGFSSRASLLKNIANTQIICDEFIFLEIGQYILSKRNNAGPQIRKIRKLIIFIITMGLEICEFATQGWFKKIINFSHLPTLIF